MLMPCSLSPKINLCFEQYSKYLTRVALVLLGLLRQNRCLWTLCFLSGSLQGLIWDLSQDYRGHLWVRERRKNQSQLIFLLLGCLPPRSAKNLNSKRVEKHWTKRETGLQRHKQIFGCALLVGQSLNLKELNLRVPLFALRAMMKLPELNEFMKYVQKRCNIAAESSRNSAIERIKIETEVRKTLVDMILQVQKIVEVKWFI